MHTDHEESEHIRIDFPDDVMYKDKVPECFGHLFIIDVDVAVMHPVVRKCCICHTFTLCNFIFMVRESQVLAARMDVDCITKVMAGHDTALDMPSRASLTPRGTPLDFTFFGLFP